MSDCSEQEDGLSKLYDEACRLTGLACLMIVSHGAEPDRISILHELERLHWLILLESGQPHAGLKLAVELLQNSGEI